MALPAAFRYDVWVKTSTGQAVNNAHVYIVQQPATVPTTESLGPPSPLATNFTDSTAGTVEPQPDVTDGFGHSEFYVASGIYTIAVYVNGSLFMTLPDQTIATSSVVATNPGGSDTQVQFNQAGVFGANSGLTYNYNTNVLTVGSGLVVTAGGLTVTAGGIKITAGGINIGGALTDGTGSVGTSGQVLSSTVTGTQWVTSSSSNPPLNAPFPKFLHVMATSATNGFSTSGAVDGTTFVPSVTQTQLQFLNGTNGYTTKYSNAGAASTNFGWCPSGFTSSGWLHNIMNWYRITLQIGFPNIAATVRYWHGMTVFGGGTTTGSNGTAPLASAGSTVFVTDSPNHTFIGWRFSTGTDTHWQAISSVAGASSPTVQQVDTGITPDTSPHLFELVQNTAGTSVQFMYDGTVVATISTGLPSMTPANAGDGQAAYMVSADNKNTATLTSFAAYHYQQTFRY